MKTGIYKILNKVNNKVYIGSAIDIKKRWRDHKWHLIHAKHHNSHLQSSFNKYGLDVFEFLILSECPVEELLIKEKEYIKLFNSDNNQFGYNVNDPEHTFLNKKHNEKTKMLLSKQKLGDKNPMFGKFGDKHHFYNKNHSIESRNKMSVSHLGIPTHRRNNHKLNVNDILNIRKLYHEDNISQPKIALMYEVSYTAINKIITRKTWSNI